jgi:putative PIN family toxin of toxin-antitoxin system
LIKVVLDTNILISAFLWSKKVRKAVVPLLEEKKILVCFSQKTIEEFIEVLSRKEFAPKFVNAGTNPEKLVGELLARENVVVIKKSPPTLLEPIIEKDPSDDKFLYLAAEAKAEYIVSGDKHLLALEEFKGIKIVSVDEFLSFIN